MGLNCNFKDETGAQRDLYFVIHGIYLNKNKTATIQAAGYTGREYTDYTVPGSGGIRSVVPKYAPMVARSFDFPWDGESEASFADAYALLKTLPEFAGATDVLESGQEVVLTGSSALLEIVPAEALEAVQLKNAASGGVGGAAIATF